LIDVTEFARNDAFPTLLRGASRVAAMPVPVIANNSATMLMTRAGDGREKTLCIFYLQSCFVLRRHSFYDGLYAARKAS